MSKFIVTITKGVKTTNQIIDRINGITFMHLSLAESFIERLDFTCDKKIDLDLITDQLEETTQPAVSHTYYSSDSASEIQSLTITVGLLSRAQESDIFLPIFDLGTLFQTFIETKDIRAYYVSGDIFFVSHGNIVYRFDIKDHTFTKVEKSVFIPGHLLQSPKSLMTNLYNSEIKYELCVLSSGVRYFDDNNRTFYPKPSTKYNPILDENDEEYIMMYCENNGKTYALTHHHIMNNFTRERVFK